ncbi:CHASE2 domain-containing protein [Sphingomonas sp. MMS24-JH45]
MVPWVGGPIDRALEPARFAVQSHAASGKVVVVEMDARSVAAIRQWPWSRRDYGIVVDRLRAAGAATIVFDVDVSTPSVEVDDRAFAAAIARRAGQAGAADLRAGGGDGRRAQPRRAADPDLR